ncbi:hypothetical protein MHI37_02180 [Paenibacillus sp. FSL H8-0548]|uniref:hypothetical protein n=1 Tax=Paenibacillus sp. FSL H8-0548 TaxID=1920422 RepID=UPI00117E5265|nr:hypothetical protein [Paenibacillus sp. FSL H8-0548]
MQRYEELDSLRGLAALAVMIGHFLLVFAPIAQNTSDLGFLDYPLNLFKYTPLHAVWGGHEAVIMFFCSAASCFPYRSSAIVSNRIRNM